MRLKNTVRTERAQLSISDNTNRILQDVADIGILGKTKAEVAARIVTDWIWRNEDRLLRQGIKLKEKPRPKMTQKNLRND
jgi:hypothetical protein